MKAMQSALGLDELSCRAFMVACYTYSLATGKVQER
jgi:hypothetical protein